MLNSRTRPATESLRQASVTASDSGSNTFFQSPECVASRTVNQGNTGQILPASVTPHLLTSLDESNKNMLTLSETSRSQSQDHVQLQMHLHSCSILQPVMFVTPVYLKAPATNLHVQLATWCCQACSRHST